MLVVDRHNACYIECNNGYTLATCMLHANRFDRHNACYIECNNGYTLATCMLHASR